jgi:hypothetical protein
MWRAFQPVSMLVMLFFFVTAILTGLAGTPAGSHNFGVVFVWIVWWALLIGVLVPFLGRAWCAICPIPAPGEWLQRRAILTRTAGRPRTFGWHWPSRLRNIWLQNAGFLALAVSSAVVLTRPDVTAWLLLGMLGVATILGALYANRVFCRYVCPVGGFIGLYALASSLELRVKDAQVCIDHRTKDCVVGNAEAYGCSWMVFPGTLVRSSACGLCTECLKACPKDNIALRLRPFGADLLVDRGRGLDEAYKALIMLACALLYSVVLLGPWGSLKNAANLASGWDSVLYIVVFIAIAVVVVPALFWLTVVGARRVAGWTIPLRRLFVDYAYGLVPLGLAAWIAFTAGFVFVNGSYALPVLSDPFGWGWDLFGTRSVPWRPMFASVVPALQVTVLLGGLVGSIVTAYRVGPPHAANDDAAWRAVLPIAGFLTIVTLVFLWLYLG